MENDGKSRGHHGTKRKKGDVFPQQILFFPSPISEVFLAASPHNRACPKICLNIVMFIGKMMINPIDFFCATDATAFDKEIPPVPIDELHHFSRWLLHHQPAIIFPRCSHWWIPLLPRFHRCVEINRSAPNVTCCNEINRPWGTPISRHHVDHF